MLISQFDSVELLLQLVDVIFLRHLHLLEDLLLRVQLSIEVLSLSDSLVDLMLELEVLLLEDLDLAVGRIKFDLSVLECKDLILVF